MIARLVKPFIKPALLAAAIMLVGVPLAGMSQSHAASKGRLPAFVHGKLVCMVNVNRWLKANGFRPTGSASSHSIRVRKRVSQPRFGDVRFNHRPGGGGHVAVALGNGLCLNPSGKRGWQKKPCKAIWPGRGFEWRRA